MSESSAQSEKRKFLLNVPSATPTPSRPHSGQVQRQTSSARRKPARPRSTEPSPSRSRSASPRESPALRRRRGITAGSRPRATAHTSQSQHKQAKRRRTKPNIDLAWMLLKLLGIQAVDFKSELRSRDTLYDCYTRALEELKRLRGHDAFPRHVVDSLHRASLHDALRALQSVVLHLRSMDCPRRTRKKAGRANKGRGRSPKRQEGQHSGPKPHTVSSAVSNSRSTPPSPAVRRSKATAERHRNRRSPQPSPQARTARPHGPRSRSRSPQQRGKANRSRSAQDEGETSDDGGDDGDAWDTESDSLGEHESSSGDNTDLDDDDDDDDDDGDNDGEEDDLGEDNKGRATEGSRDGGIVLEALNEDEGIPEGKVSRRALDRVLQRAIAHAIAAFSESEDRISQSLALKVEVCGEAYHHPRRHAFSPGTLQRFGELVVQCQQQHQQQQSSSPQGKYRPPAEQLGVVRALDILAAAMQEWVSAAAVPSPGGERRLTLTTSGGEKVDPALDLRWTAWHACRASVLQASTLRSGFTRVACFDACAPWVVCGLTSGALAITCVGAGLRCALRAPITSAHGDDVVCVCILDARARGVLFATGSADQTIAVWHASLPHAPQSAAGRPPVISTTCISRAREHYGWVRSLAAWPGPPQSTHSGSTPRWLLSGGGDCTAVLWSVHVRVGDQRGGLQPMHNTFLDSAANMAPGRTAPRRASIAPGAEGTCPGTLVFHDRSRPHTHWVVDLAWLSNSLAASCSPDCGLTLLWVERPPRVSNALARLWPLQRVEQAHANWPRCIMRYGSFLISGSSDGAVKVWRLREGLSETVQDSGDTGHNGSCTGSQASEAASRRSSTAVASDVPAAQRNDCARAATRMGPLYEGQGEGGHTWSVSVGSSGTAADGGGGEVEAVDAYGTDADEAQGVDEKLEHEAVESDVFAGETSEMGATRRQCVRRVSSGTTRRLSSSSQGGVAGRGRRVSAVRTDLDAPRVRLTCADSVQHGCGRTLALATAHDTLLVATEEDVVLRLGVDKQTGKVRQYAEGDALAPLGDLEGQVGIRRIVYSDEAGLLFLHDHLSVLPPPETAHLQVAIACDNADDMQADQHTTTARYEAHAV